MIYSDKQYAISERQLGNLREALTAANFEKADATSEHSWVRAAQADAIKSQIATLEAELSHYALLKSGEITFAKGAAEQGNFDQYEILRMGQSPRIQIKVLEGGGRIRGVGEPGTPPAAPALANAIFHATGQRIRELPLRRHIGFV